MKPCERWVYFSKFMRNSLSDGSPQPRIPAAATSSEVAQAYGTKDPRRKALGGLLCVNPRRPVRPARQAAKRRGARGGGGEAAAQRPALRRPRPLLRRPPAADSFRPGGYRGR